MPGSKYTKRIGRNPSSVVKVKVRGTPDEGYARQCI